MNKIKKKRNKRTKKWYENGSNNVLRKIFK